MKNIQGPCQWKLLMLVLGLPYEVFQNTALDKSDPHTHAHTKDLRNNQEKLTRRVNKTTVFKNRQAEVKFFFIVKKLDSPLWHSTLSRLVEPASQFKHQFKSQPLCLQQSFQLMGRVKQWMMTQGPGPCLPTETQHGFSGAWPSCWGHLGNKTVDGKYPSLLCTPISFFPPSPYLSNKTLNKFIK